MKKVSEKEELIKEDAERMIEFYKEKDSTSEDFITFLLSEGGVLMKKSVDERHEINKAGYEMEERERQLESRVLPLQALAIQHLNAHKYLAKLTREKN